MKLVLLLLLGSGWLSAWAELPGGTPLVVESDAGAIGRVESWQANPKAMCRLSALTNRSAAVLRCRFAYESQPDQTYLLRRQFTLWSNGVAQGSVTLSNLVSGSGSTRWETNELVGQVELGVAAFRVGREVLENLQVPNSKPQESTKAQAPSSELGVGLTRVTLEPYAIQCASCAGEAEPGEPGLVYGGKELRFSLGRTWYGQAVGELTMALESPRAGFCQPGGLRLLALPGSVTVVREGGELRQVGASQCLVDILKRSERRFEMRFYATNAWLPVRPPESLIPTNGLTPTARWVFEEPEGAAGGRQLRVMEERGSVWVTNLYSWTDTGWELLAGNGLRKEVFTQTREAGGRLRRELWQTFEPSDNRLVAQRSATYRTFCWGEELVEEVLGAKGEGGTNRYRYEDAPGSASTGRLREVVRSDGFWERYEYDARGRLRAEWSPFANTPLERYQEGKKVSYDYEPWRAWGDDGQFFPLQPRTTTESIGGRVVSKSYRIAGPDFTIEVRCAAPSRRPFDGLALCTTNHFYSTDAGSRTRLRSVEHPDGTMETYEYSRSPFTTTEIHCAGEPDAARAGVVSGTRTVTVLGDAGQALLSAVYDLAPGRTNILTSREACTYPDARQRSYAVTYLDGTSNVVQYACCGMDSRRDQDGVLLVCGYDALKRIQMVLRFAGSPEPVTTRYGWDAANHPLSALRVGKDGREGVRLRAAAYDTAGQVLFETNGLGGVTRFFYGFDAAGRRTSSREYPDGGKRIESFNRDGSLHEVSGSAVHGVRYEYGVNEAGLRFTRETKLSAAGEPTREWSADVVDRLGRDLKTEYPDGAFSQEFYNEKGQLSGERDPDGVLTLYGYNGRGERDTEAERVAGTNSSEAIAFAGTDRITRTIREVVFSPLRGTNVERVRRYVWGEENSGQSNLVSTVERSVDGLRSWETAGAEEGSPSRRSEWVLGPDGLGERYEYAADGSWTYSRYRCGRLELVQERDSLGGTNTQSSYRYDAHERVWQESNWRQGTVTYAYNGADLVSAVMREASGSGQKPLTTRTEYNAMLQATNVVLPGGQSVRTEYSLTGEIRRREGWHNFPVAYTCDYAGRVRTMTTWRDAGDPNTASVTVWNYDPQRGWLTQKRYADGTGPDYEHTPAGRLRKRTWAREVAPGSGVRVETRYGYNAAGDLETVRHNDGSTPDLLYEYDRCGRLQTVMQAARANSGQTAVTRLTYDLSGLPTSESYLAGPLAGLVVTNGYDSCLRRTNLTLRGAGDVLESVSYGYDGSARLKTVTQSALRGERSVSATYTYETGAPWVREVEFREGDTSRLACTRRYDMEGRPLSTAATPSGSAPITYEYSYDEAGQAARATLTDCSYWSFRYDALGQLREGLKYRSNQRPVPGEQFQYEFDDTGERSSSPYAGRGARKALRAGAQVPERLSYDADGNLTNDGRWSFTWDAENRLVRMEAAPQARPRLRLDFAYDWRGRRIQKELFTWNKPHRQYARVSRVNFVYDDWNLLAVLDSERALVASFTWGLELNPGLEGTRGGGAGGLLLVRNYPERRGGGGANHRAPETCFAAMDGHGNLVGLVNARDGRTVARYDYGPFGEALERLSRSGVHSSFRFQTRYADEETGLLYCGYRYYDSHTGRWLSREPLHEYAFWQANGERLVQEGTGDRGLYGPEDYVYVGNAPVGNEDALGLLSSCDQKVQEALHSRGNRRLLRMISKAGFPPPRVVGSDTEHYCSFPGYLGEYDCPSREGKICCGNVENQDQVERTTQHELIHALDCNRNGLETCQEHLCSEVMAYYTADCGRFVNRLECALGQMRASMAGDARCGPEASAMSERSAWRCVQEWWRREGKP